MILTGKEAAAMIDISLVRTQHTISDIRDVVELAKKYRFINVHVLPCWVANLAEMLHDVGGVYVGSPVGFPSGAATTLTKVVEAEQLIRDGVEEMDVVITIVQLQAGRLVGVKRTFCHSTPLNLNPVMFCGSFCSNRLFYHFKQRLSHHHLRLVSVPPFLTEQTGKERNQSDTDESDTAASHQLFHALAFY